MGSYFAPESFLTKDGRRVMQAWLRLGTRPANLQSLPRELSLPEDGVLRIKPLRELETLRHGEKTKRNITLKKNKPHKLRDISGDNIELKVKFAATAANSFGVNVLCDKEGNKGLKIAYNAKSKVLEFGDINPPFELKKGEDLTLRIFIDKDVVEVFVNDRQAAANVHKYDPKQVYVNLFAYQHGVKVKEVKSWKMKTIYN
jgi:beta-fructofuranosidase